jgi:phosphonopyruvate decarboxylase
MGAQLMTAVDEMKRIDRRAFIAELLGAVPEALVVTGLGSPTYDVCAAGDRDLNFYLWGAMGGSTPIGLGLALAQPRRSVLVVTGDGEQMMGIGSLATVAAQQPPNLTVVVLDNGYFGETGMQRSHSGLGTDLALTAKGLGIADSLKVDDLAAVPDLAARIEARANPVFVQALIDIDEPPRAMPPRDGTFVKNRFRAAMGLGPI